MAVAIPLWKKSMPKQDKPTTHDLTRQVLAANKWRVFTGKFTLEDTVREVRKLNKWAKREGIYDAIEEYGPIGEGDVAWFESPIQARYYDPKTRKGVSGGGKEKDKDTR